MKEIPGSLSRLSPAQRQVLQKLLQEKLATDTPDFLQNIAPRSEQEDMVCSFSQEQLWLLDQLEPGNISYNIPVANRLKGPLHLPAFEQSLQEIVRRHDVLRTIFVNQEGQPRPVLVTDLHIAVPLVDLQQMEEEEQQKAESHLLQTEVQRPFNLTTGPLLRALLLRLNSTEHIFLLVVHHITSDGWSMNVLAQELSALYNAFVRKQPSPLPALPFQYADFARWQRDYLQGEMLDTQLAYWARQLDGVVPLELPTDYPRPAHQTYKGAHQLFPLPQRLCDKIRELSRKEEVTLFMLLLAAFQTWLYRYTGQTNIAIGTPIANRTRPGVEGLIGFFLNTLVIHNNLSGKLRFIELLKQVRQTTLEAFARQDIPFAKLVAELQPARSLSHAPFFQVLFILQETSMMDVHLTLSDITQTLFPVESGTAQADLTFQIRETERHLEVYVEYNTDLFAARTIQRMLFHWRNMLEGIVATPEKPLLALPILNVGEEQRLLGWFQQATEIPPFCVHELFERRAAATPDAIALIFEDEHVTYACLDTGAEELARELHKLGVQTEELVGIYLPRSPWLLLALLGILKAGGVYLPLDPSYPAERLAFMVADSRLSVVVTVPEFQGTLSAGVTHRVCLPLNGTEPAFGAERAQDRRLPPIPEQLAYVIYTSGSTGRPKGTAITHQALMNFCESMRQSPGMEAHDIVLAITSLSFDIAALELILPVLLGARVRIASWEVTASGTALANLLEQSGATILQATPTSWRMLLSAGWSGNARLKMLCGGEELSFELARQLRSKGASLWNMYGPTETTIWSAIGQIEEAKDPIVIGEAIANTQLLLLDQYLRPVPEGVIGELYIGGEGLARGYMQRPDVTAERFLPNPWSKQAGARMYRTGDLGRRLASGQFVCLGRIDRQVKVRGFRIELGEIEAVLERHAAVRECAVLLRGQDTGDGQLVAYVVLRDGIPFSLPELREYLKQHLPAHMVPSDVVLLETFPQTPNGKVDRRALPAPERQAAWSTGIVTLPRTPIEEILYEIWRSLLHGRSNQAFFGVYDDFFALGGHSLLGTQLLAHIRAVLQVELPLRSLFDHPTVAGQAKLVEQEQRGERSLPILPLEPAGQRGQTFPLSPAQQRLWFLDQLEPGNPAYLIAAARRLHGRLHHQGLEESLQVLVHRHESLRTTFGQQEGQSIQRVASHLCLGVPVVDLKGVKERTREQEWKRLSRQEGQRSCDLERGPLLRVWVLQLEEQEAVLLLTAHHIISDGWSGEIFFRELAAQYRGWVEGRVVELPALPIQYADFALWQRQWLRGAYIQEQLDYWRRQLEGAPVLELPIDYPRPSEQSYRGQLRSIVLPLALRNALIELSQKEGVTLFMLLLAAFQVLLARYSGQSDLSIGTPIANRTRTEVEGLIGFFVNTLVLRADVSDNPLFVDLLHRVRELALEAYAHQDVPFEQVVDALQPERTLHRSPLFQVMLSLQQETGRNETLEGLTWSELEIEQSISKFDLTLFIFDGKQGMRCSFEYNSDLFAASTVERLLASWQTLLEGIVENVRRRIEDLPLLSDTEQHLLLYEWNAPQTVYTETFCLHELFEAQAKRSPDAVALVYEEASLTYRALDATALQVARHLQARGVGQDILVGICMERSLEMVVGLLAILKAGGVYVPLDPSYPAERLTFMLEDARVALVLSQPHLRERLPDSTCIVYLDGRWETTLEVPDCNPLCNVQPENLAYMIYTSGSTGRPKGAMNTHKGICNRLLWMQDAYQLTSEDSVLQKTSFSFDVSVWEFFWPLIVGARLVMALPGGHQDSNYLVEVIEQERITTLHFVPSMLRAFLEERRLERCAHLKRVICSGEALSFELQERFFSQFARFDVALHNLYGPTESAVDVTFWSCRPDADLQIVPIGQPIANTQIYLLDKYLRLAPLGGHAELYIGGVNLARGYHDRPDLTAERFIAHPFSSIPGARLYRTGDLARYVLHGTAPVLEYLGRIDQQVKLRGFRIELGEIEASLSQQPGVNACVVMLRENTLGIRQLVAYIVPEREPGAALELHHDHLRAALQRKLPEYMLPSAFVVLETLPLSANGKIDRRALPAPEAAQIREGQPLLAPRTERERTLADIWSQVLGGKPVGVRDNFFALGGDSILSMQVASMAREAGFSMTPKLLFQHQTIAEMATALGQEPDKPSVKAEQGPLSGTVPLTPIQKWFFEQQFPDLAHFNQAVLLQVRRPLKHHLLAEALNSLVLHHDTLRLRFSPQRDQSWEQYYTAPQPEHILSVISLAGLAKAEQALALQAGIADLHASLNLQQGPVVQAGYFDLGKQQPARLFLVSHHLLVDGVSWRILVMDLEQAYEQLEQGQEVRLPARTSSFRDWSLALQEVARQEEIRAESASWLEVLRPGQPLPVDSQGRENTVASTRTITSTLSVRETRALLAEVHQAYHTRINDILLTALAQTLAAWTKENRVLFDLEGHGRDTVAGQEDLSRTIGWFTSLYPVALDLSSEDNQMQPGKAIKSMKEQLRRIPHSGIGYGLLRYLSEDVSLVQQIQALPQPQIVFNYLGQADRTALQGELFELVPGDSSPARSPRQRRTHLLEVNLWISGEQLHASWNYSQDFHTEDTISTLAESYQQALQRLIAHCSSVTVASFTPSDFPLVSLSLEQLEAFQESGVEIEDIYPLSPVQEGLLFHTLYHPRSGMYVTQLSWRLTGEFHLEIFERSWQFIIEKYAILRTAFLWDGKQQYIQRVQSGGVRLPLYVLDWRELSQEQQQAQRQALLQADRARGFALEEAPLMRLTLAYETDERISVLWSHHHLLLDGWSLPLLLRDVLDTYQQFLQGKMPAEQWSRPYRDYILWLQQQDLPQAERYWRQRLAGLRAPTPIPAAMRGRQREQIQMDGMRVSLEKAATQRLQKVIREHHLTLNSLLRGTWAILLSRYSGEQDIIFGATVAGRGAGLAGIEEMVGLFINTLPVRLNVAPEQELWTWLRQVQQEQQESQEYEFAPLVKLQEWSEMGAGVGLFESVLVFENYPVNEAVLEQKVSLRIDDVEVREQTNYGLLLQVSMQEQGLSFAVSYDKLRLSREAVERLLAHWQMLLQSLGTGQPTTIGSLPMITEGELQQLLIEWNATTTDYPADRCLPELFEEQVKCTPDGIALIYEEQYLSYEQLNRRANQLAHHLQSLGVGPDVLVGICLHRSIEMIIGLLAVFKAGGVSLPLDPTYPQERLAFLLEDTHVPLLLTHQPSLTTLPASPAITLCLDSEWPRVALHPQHNPSSDTLPDHLASLIYTSGSTGTPKGVMISHRALGNRLRWGLRATQLGARDRALQVASLSFDIALWEIFGPLLSGACLVLAPPDGYRDSRALLTLLEHEQITVAHFVPSLFQLLLQAPELARCRRLRWVLYGGEASSPDLPQQFFAQSDARLQQFYGPTEATINATWWSGDPQCPTRQANIGRPIENMRVYVLDAQGQPVPIGVTGELYLGGVGLARGYWQRPDLSAERFVPDACSGESGERLYRTGDLVRYHATGELEFVGRNDSQVKLRGYRIELGEIEVKLRAHPQVQDAVVLVREDVPGDKRLVASVVRRSDQALSLRALHSFLRERLPVYMLPAAFVFLDALPLTPNGKLDRRSLLTSEQWVQDEEESARARTPMEELVQGLWSRVLGRAQIGRTTNFFAVGGHSLLATRLLAQIRAVVGVEVPLRALFEEPTVAGFARRVEHAVRQDDLIPQPPLLAGPRPAVLPLSYAQQRLWFLEQLEPESPAYLMPSALSIQGRVQTRHLEGAFTALVSRHESLRTTFAEQSGQPIQVIHPAEPYMLPVIDLQEVEHEQREQEVQRLVTQEAQHPCDLAQGPLLRTTLLRLDTQEHVLLLTLQHIISDGWSMGVFMRELTTLYRSLVAGEPSSLAPLPIQYADYALWQRAWLQGAVLDAQVRYWTTRLQDLSSLNLPTDYPRPAVQSSRGSRQRLLLSLDLLERLKARSQQEGVTLFMTLLAAFLVLLWRYSGQEDLAVGVPIANRIRYELEGLIGFFVNTLVLRTTLAGNPTFRELLGRVREVALGAYSHQDVPFEKLVETLQPERDLSRSPLFQVMFQLENELDVQKDWSAVRLSALPQPGVTSKFDLTWEIRVTSEGLLCLAEYSTALFEESTIVRWLGHWQVLLEGIVERGGEQRLSELPLLSRLELEQMKGWNQTQREQEREGWVHQLVEGQVERTPDAVAVSCGEENLSYEQLNRRANQLALKLGEARIGQESIVGVFLERSLSLVTTVLAIFKAGDAYLPLDPLHPTTRVRLVLEQSGCPLVLSSRAMQVQLEAVLADISLSKRPCVLMIEDILTRQESVPGNLTSCFDAASLAYVIYTSGSTGQPKGVMVEQQGMRNHMLAKIAHLNLGAVDKLAQNGPLGFDISVWQSLAPLIQGGQVHIIPDEIALDPDRLLYHIEERGVTLLQVVPSMLRSMLAEAASEGASLPELASLRWIIPTGDALPTDLCQQWLSLYPHIPLLNTYGSTECSDDQCHYALSRLLEREERLPVVPIGFPIANMQAYVLDQALHQVPVGIVGDLYLGGIGVGRGYLGDPGRTALAFVPDTVGKRNGARLYKTGDTVRYLPNGNLEFLGRSDQLVKVRGYRIELGEIEEVLRAYPEIHEVVVVVRESGLQERHLIAYLVSQKPEPDFSPGELRRYVQERLPGYMVPSFFIFLKALPLNVNGKVDRKALPDPEQPEDPAYQVVGQERSPIEDVLIAVWSEILDREQIGIHDNFFALGGHSLLATKLIARLRNLVGVELPLRTVFEAPTIEELASRVKRALSGEQQKEISVPAARERTGDLLLSFAQQRLWFLHQLEPDNPAYNIAGGVRLRGQLMVEVLERSLTEIIRRHESLRTTFQDRGERVVQVIHPAETFSLLQRDLSALAFDRREEEIQHLAGQAENCPFDLTAAGPLLRIMLLRLSAEEHVLLLTMHHIISDGWSMEIFVRELTTLYRAFVAGQPSPLASLPVQYADFALWQREQLQGVGLEKLMQYWKKQLRGAVPLELPSELPRTAIASNRGAVHSFTLSPQLSQRIHALSRQESVTLFMLLLTAFQTLLARVTGQQDIVVGTDIANRTYAETEEIIGFFVNLLVLRTSLNGRETFREALRKVCVMVLNAYAHQDLPFEQLINALQIERVASQTPLINVLFVLQNTSAPVLELEGLVVEPLEIQVQRAKFDLAVFLVENERQVTGYVHYRTDLFAAEAVSRWCAQFEILLQSIVASPDAVLTELEMASEDERQQQLRTEIELREARRSKLKTTKRLLKSLSGASDDEV